MMMKPGRFGCVPVVAAGLVLLAGCGGRVSTETWRERVDAYVLEEAERDPNVLSRVDLTGGRRGFAVLGAADPERSTDVVGVLVGHRQIRGRPWFIYLVGTVKRGELQEAHVAAAHWREGGFRWVVGEPDSEALARYRSHLERRASGGGAEAGALEGSSAGWPREADDYGLRLEADAVVVRERRSGARWTLPLGAFRKHG